MTTFHFQTHVSDSGVIILPPGALNLYGKNVVVNVDVDDKPNPAKILPNGKTAIQDFLDYCREQPPMNLTDEELEQLRYEAMKEKYGL